jgi:hypothetical protein
MKGSPWLLLPNKPPSYLQPAAFSLKPASSATESLRDWMRLQLDQPEGKLAAIAGVQTFGDYLVFHSHLHILSASGLFDQTGTFHLVATSR